MLAQLYNNKIVRFIIAGGLTFLINLGLIYWLIDRAGFNTPLLRNLANIISIEVSLIASFIIYRLWVWKDKDWNIRDMLIIQLPLFHLSAGAAVLLRVVLIFPLLDAWQVSPGVNTFIGVLIGATLNYVANDTIIFKSKNKSDRS